MIISVKQLIEHINNTDPLDLYRNYALIERASKEIYDKGWREYEQKQRKKNSSSYSSKVERETRVTEWCKKNLKVGDIVQITGTSYGPAFREVHELLNTHFRGWVVRRNKKPAYVWNPTGRLEPIKRLEEKFERDDYYVTNKMGKVTKVLRDGVWIKPNEIMKKEANAKSS